MLCCTKRTISLLWAVAVCLCLSISFSNAQENAQFQIPPSLVECYNTTYFMNRDNRLPSTMNTLISLIEKVENSYEFNMDIRTLSVALLHRFRQDGIQRAQGLQEAPGIIPFSPSGPEFTKFRILLQLLIPGNALQFPNSTLTREERCSLHFMLSQSIDLQTRGDEGQVCTRLSDYKALRFRRDAKNIKDDYEMLETEKRQKRLGKLSKQLMRNPYSEYDDYGVIDSSISSCPVENGVVWTPWGSVSAGTVIAGIAAGLQPQSVQLRTLLAYAKRQGPIRQYNNQNMPQTATINVDNRWAATLAGDLSEVTLLQVKYMTENNDAVVGVTGAWNSTVMRHWYFLNSNKQLEMTEAQIRGGLDGLIMALNIQNWRTQASNMRLSQLLRMYYSMNGVLGSGIMACNRKDTFNNLYSNNPNQLMTTMVTQVTGFSQVLDREMQLPYTLDSTSIPTFAEVASNALSNYISKYSEK